MTFRPAPLFERLRTLMQHEQLDELLREHLARLMRHARVHDTSSHTQTWVPYLSGFPKHLRDPFYASFGMADDRYADMPCARFEIVADRISAEGWHHPIWARAATVHFLSWEDLLACIDSGVALPSLEALTLNLDRVSHDEVARLRSWSALAGIRKLTLHVKEHARAQAASLVETPALHYVEELELDAAWQELVYAAAHSTALVNLRRLRLHDFHDGPTSLTGLVDSPLCERLESLDLSTHRSTSGQDQSPMVEVLATGTFGKLGMLDLSHIQLGVRGARALRASGLLEHVHTLRMNRCGLEVDAARQLAQARGNRNVDSLEFAGNRIGNKGVTALVEQAAWLAPKRRLDLSDTYMTSKGAKVMARAPRLEGVTSLDLSGNRIDDVGVESLVEHGVMRDVHDLRLSRCRLTHRGMRALATTSWSALSSLDVSGNVLGERGAAALASGSELKDVRQLVLMNCRLGDAGAIALSDAARLGARLERLDLSENDIGPDGIIALTRRFFPPTLRDLDLDGNTIEDRGALALARCERLRELVRLNLGYTGIESDGKSAEALRCSEHLPNITDMWIGRTSH